MRPETEEVGRALRYGYTTGACATAASVAAARAALNSAGPHHHSPLCKRGAGGDFPLSHATIHLPRGQHATFPLETLTFTADGAEAAVIKDAGDDPDVTHGARIWAQVQLSTGTGVQFRAGSGVGTVTLPGLPIPVGEPAINPTPRRMITEHFSTLATMMGYTGGFVVTIGVDNGAALAQKTLNPRLGIIGGLSILGTTGIVRPFSCSAYIFSIRRAIDVAHANGCTHIGACTGAASEQCLRTECGLPDVALIEMGDFAGAVLKYLRKVPIPQLSIAGGFGKISKLAAGHLNLHSAHSTVDMPWLAKIAGHLGADATLQQEIAAANTSQQALALAHRAGLPLGNHLCQLARDVACAIVARDVVIAVWAIDRAGMVVGKAKCQLSLA